MDSYDTLLKKCLTVHTLSNPFTQLLIEGIRKHPGFTWLTVSRHASSLHSRDNFKAIYLSFFGGLASVKTKEKRLNINSKWYTTIATHLLHISLNIQDLIHHIIGVQHNDIILIFLFEP